MKIGIDGRLIYQTGVGRYIRNLLNNLARLDQQNEYRIFLGKDAFSNYHVPNTRWQKRFADVRWHTFKEQMIMPKLLSEEKLDLVHIPYFNVPIFYTKPMIVTIHDLTILHYATGRATTLPKYLYITRRLGYLMNLAIGLQKVRKIITVSNNTKNDIMKSCHVPEDKIAVTYEGIDQIFRFQKSGINTHNRVVAENYFLYVGNAYPHKNLSTLLTAFSLLLKRIGRTEFPKRC